MHAVEIYQTAVAHVPAYRDFLRERLGAIPTVASEEDFKRLPCMTKQDYVMRYPVKDLCMDGNPAGGHLWLRSSGTSKKPFFWPRRVDDERGMPGVMRDVFRRYLDPGEQPVLIVVGLALGPWGTGMQTSFAFRNIAREVPGLAVVSPGLQNENIIEVLERIAPLYRRTLLLSYPPFAKMVLEEAARRGVDLPALNLELMVGGEGITETWREHMWRLSGHGARDLQSVWSMYGSTDFANVGFETPLTIAMRRLMQAHDLCNQLLGEPDLPMLFQQLPSTAYFEEAEGELVVSRVQGIPLVRYRSGDHVRFIARNDLTAGLRALGHDPEAMARAAGSAAPDYDLPLIALYGRIDQTVFFYGAKITVEQVKTALEHPAMQPYYNGRFLVRGGLTDAGDPQVQVVLEDGPALRAADLDELAAALANSLDGVQSEFRSIRALAPGRPHLRIVPGSADMFELGWKTRHF